MSNLEQTSQGFKPVKLTLVLGGLIFLVVIGLYGNTNKQENNLQQSIEQQAESREVSHALSLEDQVIPKNGVTLPITWDDLGAQMVNKGVINDERFGDTYERRGGLSEDQQALVYGENDEVVMTRKNAGVILNLLWAFGLSNKNPVLTEGPMVSEKYGSDPSRFASTGGWTLAKGDVMNHYSKHAFVTLTAEQQKRVENIAKSVYRPCCGNSTYFPDCNHGMAMLGLLQLMASQNVSEQKMWETALQVNSYWFPETYMTLATYFKQQGTEWDDVDPRLALGREYSSASGYQRILQEVQPSTSQDESGCSV